MSKRMSSKIELPACECGSVDVSIGYESPQGYWVECGDCGYQTDKSHLRELVVAWWSKRAAPVVERRSIGHISLKPTPPELAELQATIAQLTADLDSERTLRRNHAARIHELSDALKGGQGEPIYQVQYRGDGGGGWSDAEKASYDAKVPHPDHWMARIVYASQPAPVSVLGLDIFKALEKIRGAPALTTNQCIDLARELNACLDKVKELNQ